MSIQNLFNLSGKTAIVTGVGNGIGKACCEILFVNGGGIQTLD
ncbi:hypothetical protein [Pseudoflavitalea rhizosphaerae]|nr:hypothetical protein [Pseudoflavitalea rhizosphaerae]